MSNRRSYTKSRSAVPLGQGQLLPRSCPVCRLLVGFSARTVELLSAVPEMWTRMPRASLPRSISHRQVAASRPGSSSRTGPLRTCPPSVKNAFYEQGFRAIEVRRDRRKAGRDELDYLPERRKEQAIFVTSDRKFVERIDADRLHHAGIVWIPKQMAVDDKALFASLRLGTSVARWTLPLWQCGT